MSPFFSGGSKAFWYRGLYFFDVSSLVGLYTSIDAAQLELKKYSAGGTDAAKLSRCTRPGTTTEAGVTWNKYDGTNAWTSGGGDFDDTTPGVVSFTFTDPPDPFVISGLAGYITDAIANRSNIVALLTRMSDESASGSNRGFFGFSKEGATPPVLRVTYTPVAGAADRRRLLAGLVG